MDLIRIPITVAKAPKMNTHPLITHTISLSLAYNRYKHVMQHFCGKAAIEQVNVHLARVLSIVIVTNGNCESVII